jgi:xylulose-5-phosphate/fructose-6-phosphate phosphoketolase
MPGQLIEQPNPPPDVSLIPESALELAVHLDTNNYLGQHDLQAVQAFRRAANYIAAGMCFQVVAALCLLCLPAMIFLNDNVLLEEKLSHDHIKHRLLGHWGTCPGLVLVYAHLNRIIRKTGLDALYVVGPGHGAPAILSCLWLEDSLGAFFPAYKRDYHGLKQLITSFSVPGGFPRYAESNYISPIPF